jgi:hypothetical protein
MLDGSRWGSVNEYAFLLTAILLCGSLSSTPDPDLLDSSKEAY